MRWPCGGSPEITRAAFFSEGCALRVRVVRPHECRGLSFPIHALTMVRWPRGDMPRSNRSLPCGRAEPAPPRNRTPDKENERLQRRDAPVRRDPPLYGRPRPATPRRLSGHRNTWGSEGEMLGRGAGFVYGACWVRPLRGSRPNMVSTACVLLARRCVFGFGWTWCALEASI